MATSNQPGLQEQVANTVRLVRVQIRWKPGKDSEHLAKRIHYRHLPPDTTLGAYEAIITSIVQNPLSRVYLFHWGNDRYPTVVAIYNDQIWLVMFSFSGIMETAFPPDKPDQYFVNPNFEYLGIAQELGL